MTRAGPGRGGRWPLAALGAILLVTAAWWTLALWPAGEAAPAWVARTRAVCFGAAPGALPDGAGWAALIGQPLVMLAILLAGWGREVVAALRSSPGVTGRLALVAVGLASLAVPAGLALAGAPRPFARPVAESPAGPSRAAAVPGDPVAPPLVLTDQTGATFDLRAFRGRPVLVGFAYAHCGTVCPSLVHEVAAARRRLGERGIEAGAVVVTLDPWRDTPRRLASIARRWSLGDGVRLLSGSVERVEATLDAWRVPRRRDLRSGELLHPRLVFVVGPDGRLAYTASGGIEELATLATRALAEVRPSGAH